MAKDKDKGKDKDAKPRQEAQQQPKAPKKDGGDVAAPRFCFVGRDEELEILRRARRIT